MARTEPISPAKFAHHVDELKVSAKGDLSEFKLLTEAWKETTLASIGYGDGLEKMREALKEMAE